MNLLLEEKPIEAMNYFKEAIAANPHCLEAHVELGYILGSMDKYGDALNAFQKAVEIDDNFPGLFGQGLAYYFLGKYDNAKIN